MDQTTKPDLSRYQEKLRALYERLQNDQDALERTGLHDNVLDSTGEITAHDNHPGDMGTEVYLRERDLLMEENLERILEQCRRALRKIEEGTYGYSDLSGDFIGEERLDAVPYATLTIEEQERADVV